MFLMADSAYAPDTAQLAGAYKAGVNAWGGYLQSPYAYHPWSAAECHNVLNAGLLFLPVYVGPESAVLLTGADGTAGANNALADLRGKGLPVNTVALDIEFAAWNANSNGSVLYARAFTARFHEAVTDSKVVLYGPKVLLADVARQAAGPAMPDSAWLAYWVPDEPSPTVLADNYPLGREWSGVGQRAWQYRGAGPCPGAPTASVDLSVCADGFPIVRPEPPIVPASTAVTAPATAAVTTAPSWTVVVNGKVSTGTGKLSVTVEG